MDYLQAAFGSKGTPNKHQPPPVTFSQTTEALPLTMPDKAKQEPVI
jgi:hypothetical protein